MPHLDAWERPEIDISISVQQKKYQAGYLVVTTCSSTTAFSLPILSWLIMQSHSAKVVVPRYSRGGTEPCPCKSRENTHPPDCYSKCPQTGHLIGQAAYIFAGVYKWWHFYILSLILNTAIARKNDLTCFANRYKHIRWRLHVGEVWAARLKEKLNIMEGWFNANNTVTTLCSYWR